MTSVVLYPGDTPSHAERTADRVPDISGKTWVGWFDARPTSGAIGFTEQKLERPPTVVVSDVDSTLIEEEVIDQLAHMAGVGAEVAAITEGAMRGNLDFTQSLTQRVKLLEGLPTSALTEVAGTLSVRPGVTTLINWVHSNGGVFAVVSGGFTPIVSLLAKDLGIDFFLANDFEIKNEALTGRVQGRTVTAATKLETLRSLKREHGGPVIALGDGANDIPMLQAADLGIAVLAKPKVKESVGSWIETDDLSSAIGLAGFPVF